MNTKNVSELEKARELAVKVKDKACLELEKEFWEHKKNFKKLAKKKINTSNDS